MTTTSSNVSISQPEVEYVKIDYKTLPRRRIQPTGHSDIYFLPNPKIQPTQYNIFTNAKIVLDAAKKVSSINVIDLDNSTIEFDKLKNKIINNYWCRGITPNYVERTLEDNYGILFIDKNIISSTHNKELLAFATIRLLQDNRYDHKRYLEIDLLCANVKYKHMGTKMLDTLVDIAIHSNCKYIHVEALDNVVEFYRKYGFVEDKSSLAIKEKGLTRMEFKILSEEEYKESEKYKENYGKIEEYGGKPPRKLLKINKINKTNKNKKNKNKKNRNKKNKNKTNKIRK
jgi:predicted GNAT family N-acyltransferase